MVPYIAPERNSQSQSKKRNKKKGNHYRLLFFLRQIVTITLQENPYTESKQRGSYDCLYLNSQGKKGQRKNLTNEDTDLSKEFRIQFQSIQSWQWKEKCNLIQEPKQMKASENLILVIRYAGFRRYFIHLGNATTYRMSLTL